MPEASSALIARDYDVPKRPIFVLDGLDVVQSEDLAAYVSRSVMDNVMYGTNGNIGIVHCSEQETVGFRTRVFMNGVYHSTPLESNICSDALPTELQRGATICEMSLDCRIEDEVGTLTTVPFRRMSMEDGAYYSVCKDVISSDGAVTFDASYRRVVSLNELDTWAADVEYTNFHVEPKSRDSEDGNSGEWNGIRASYDSQERYSPYDQGSNSATHRPNDLVFEVAMAIDLNEWMIVQGDSLEEVTVESITSGMYLNTLTCASCTINYGSNVSKIPGEVEYTHTPSTTASGGVPGRSAFLSPRNKPSDSDSDRASPGPPVNRGRLGSVVEFVEYNNCGSPQRGTGTSIHNTNPNHHHWGGTMSSTNANSGASSQSYAGAASSNVPYHHPFFQSQPNNMMGGASVNTGVIGGMDALGDTQAGGDAHANHRILILKKRFRYALRADSIPQSITLSLICRHERGERSIPRPFSTVQDIIAAQVPAIGAFWKDICIDLQLQDEVHPNRTRLATMFNVFRLFCVSHAAGRGIPRAGCSAAGTGMLYDLRTYVAHGFFFTFVLPQCALALLKSLWAMLPQARRNASLMSLPNGAIFPESTITGTECRQYLTVNNARFYPNADVGYLVSMYFTAVDDIQTQDRLMLLELMLETARVWPHLGEWSEGDTIFRLDNIAGPDEYNTSVSGSFYIHLSAKKHMEATVMTFERQLHVLGKEAAERFLSSINMTMDEIMNLRRTSKGIAVRRNDHTGVYMQHDYFDTLKEWRGERAKHPLFLNYHPLAIYRHKLVEIPEVLLGMLLYVNEFEECDVIKNLAYYEPFCTHDAPESLAVVATMQLRSRCRLASSVPLLRSLVHLDIDNITYAAEEGLHFGAMSSSWIAIACGIGGMRTANGVLHFNPYLPPGVRSVAFSVQWRGSVVKTTIDAGSISYELVRGDSLRFIHASQNRIHLHVGFRYCKALTTIKVPRLLNYHASDFDGVIFFAECLLPNMTNCNYLAWQSILESLFEGYRTLHQREIPPLSEEEFTDKVIFQSEEREMAFSGIHRVLLDRGFDLELGTPDDAEIVETRYGLANAKVAEVAEVLERVRPQITRRFVRLIQSLANMNIPMAVVSYSRSLGTMMAGNEEVSSYFSAGIDGEEVHDRHIKGRPHLELYVRAAEKIHVPPHRCVVFSSNINRAYQAPELAQFRMFFDVKDAFVKRPQGPYPTLDECDPSEIKTLLDHDAYHLLHVESTESERSFSPSPSVDNLSQSQIHTYRPLVIPLTGDTVPYSTGQLEKLILRCPSDDTPPTSPQKQQDGLPNTPAIGNTNNTNGRSTTTTANTK